MKLRYRFKKAETPEEFEQIFRLNYAVFAGELEQHPAQPGERLVDKFHDRNRYVIALAGDEVIGMIAVHNQPPFSVAAKLADPRVLDGYGRLLEVRLLAVDPAHRNGVVMAGLMLGVYEHAREFDAMVISGHVEKAGIYHELGFRDLGPPVASGQALFVPMAIRVADLAERQARWQRRLTKR
ncbi:MAG TPA: GNAT family N-acetyltransferase [Bryobacteraceae bacterium]|nr:GNAT family N-acetyltransferase [Bryobacteraceae bacterium]